MTSAKTDSHMHHNGEALELIKAQCYNRIGFQYTYIHIFYILYSLSDAILNLIAPTNIKFQTVRQGCDTVPKGDTIIFANAEKQTLPNIAKL